LAAGFLAAAFLAAGLAVAFFTSGLSAFAAFFAFFFAAIFTLLQADSVGGYMGDSNLVARTIHLRKPSSL
jgi:hypothetical protein